MKLLDNYINIVLSSYTNFHSGRTIIFHNTGILLLDYYSGVILFIGIAAKHNEPNTI